MPAQCIRWALALPILCLSFVKPTARQSSRYLVQPSFEGVLAMHKIITGRLASHAEIEQLRASMIEDGVR
jgi:hypothetical protein